MADQINHQIKIGVKIYGREWNVTKSHSFCVDDESSAISTSPIGYIHLDFDTHKVSDIRQLLKYNTSGDMNRHSLLFQEALFIMKRMPNYYDRPSTDLTLFRIGFLNKNHRVMNTTTTSSFVTISHEDQLVSTFISFEDILQSDLLIVPLSQLNLDIEQQEEEVICLSLS